MSEDSDQPADQQLEPLPAEKLCNHTWSDNPNPIYGDGALGNEKTEQMYYGGNDKTKLVITLQKMLRKLDYDLGTSGPDKDGADGKFEDKTEEAVRDFQGKNRDWDGRPLNVDGLVGPDTADSLNRKMVGIEYDYYATPKELTIDYLLVTATQDSLKKSISLNSGDVTRAKLVLVGLDEYIITLLDSSGNCFSFEGEGLFKVQDEKEVMLAEGKMTSKDDIKFKSGKVPYVVKLSVGQDIFTFFVEDSIVFEPEARKDLAGDSTAFAKGTNATERTNRGHRIARNAHPGLTVAVKTNYTKNGAKDLKVVPNWLPGSFSTDDRGIVVFRMPSDGIYQIDIDVGDNLINEEIGPNMRDVDGNPNPPDILYRSDVRVQFEIQKMKVKSAEVLVGAGRVTKTPTKVEVFLQPIWINARGKTSRPPDSSINLIVLHHPGAGDKSSLDTLTTTTGKSAHYFIASDGEIIKLVKESEQAWHAGYCSIWGRHKQVNAFSIGIEICHTTGCYTDEQYTALIGDSSHPGLLHKLLDAYNIPKHRIVGHGDVATHGEKINDCIFYGKHYVLGKKYFDPGSEFVWEKLEIKGLGLVPLLVGLTPIYGGFFDQFPSEQLRLGDNDGKNIYGGKKRSGFNNLINELQKDLDDIGYSVELSGNYDMKTVHAVQMFQVHFHMGVNGIRLRRAGGSAAEPGGNLDYDTALMIKGVRQNTPCQNTP